MAKEELELNKEVRLDPEWFMLILEAQKIGLTPKEIKEYLQETVVQVR